MRERLIHLAHLRLHHQLHVHGELAERAPDQGQETPDLGDVIANCVLGNHWLTEAELLHQAGLRLHRAGLD